MHIAAMTVYTRGEGEDAELDSFLEAVRHIMAEALCETPLGKLITDFGNILGTGKMLRSRLAYRLAPTAGCGRAELAYACAAVEMVHAASLLHDDVIDGGIVRRGAPTFWLERGISGAILLGDLLLFKALEMTCSVHEDCRWTKKLVQLTGHVCQAESEQELLLRGTQPTWDRCVRIARYKTGALFAFIGFASANGDIRLQEALEEAGYLVGTAYQLADDILDASGMDETSGKTLGTDEAREKITAATATAISGIDPVERIETTCSDAHDLLAPWPVVQAAWNRYMQLDIEPELRRNLQTFSRVQASCG